MYLSLAEDTILSNPRIFSMNIWPKAPLLDLGTCFKPALQTQNAFYRLLKITGKLQVQSSLRVFVNEGECHFGIQLKLFVPATEVA